MSCCAILKDGTQCGRVPENNLYVCWIHFHRRQYGVVSRADGTSPRIPPKKQPVTEEITNTAHSMSDKTNHKISEVRNQKMAKKSEFYKCGSCFEKIHLSAKSCPHCGFPRAKESNWRTCTACNDRTPRYVRRKYSRYNQWDEVFDCRHCGKMDYELKVISVVKRIFLFIAIIIGIPAGFLILILLF